MCDHTVFPATSRRRWTWPALTRAKQAGTRFTYRWWMESWVDLGVGCIPRQLTCPLAVSHPGDSDPTRSWDPRPVDRNGGNTQSRTCTSRLVQETWPSDMISCTRFFLYKFLAPNLEQLYSIQETCMDVTRMVSSDWSAASRCHVFFCCVYVVDNLVVQSLYSVFWFIF